MRPDWDVYFMGVAEAVAERGDCTRRQVGAVIVHGGRIVSTGYNGSPPGAASCLAGECPRGRMSYEDIQAGSPYGTCIALHAERNAILYAPQEKLSAATLYVTAEPCAWCAELIAAKGIARTVWE